MTRGRARSSTAIVAAWLALSVATLICALPAAAATPATRSRPGSVAAAPVQKSTPLDPLSAAEIRTVYRIIRADPRFPASGFVPSMMLQEPPKAEVLAWQPGQSFSRRATINVYDRDANVVNEVVVDLTGHSVESWQPRPGVEPAVYGTEWTEADTIVRKDPRWQAAIAARGLKPKDIYIDVWAPGDTSGTIDPNGDRLLRAITFYRGDLPNPYDRPVEGITVTIDMTTRSVIDVTDSGTLPVDKTETGDARVGRHGLKPLIVHQPQGPSFDIQGREVSWQGWRFRVDYSPREGMILHQIGFEQGGVVRPIIYRLALSEIYVPYGIPDPSWAWRTAFDVGEYDLGQYAEPLQRGVDVPSNAVFFNESAASDTVADGGVVALPHAEAMFERDAGSLWDRTDPSTYERDARLARELVVTAAYVIGNYTYDIEYSFRQDGSIGVRVGATGTTLNQGIDSIAAGDRFGASLTPTVAAPAHQHFLSFRIDFDVDGTANDVMSEETAPAPSAAGNAFVLKQTPITSEGFADANAETGRAWTVESSSKVDALGSPTAYTLMPDSWTVPYSAPTFPGLQRAAFAAHPFWVTTYAPEQLYAAGDYPIAGDVGDGLARYVTPAQPIGGNDVVVWYTTGFTHHPEPEEYPVMTTDSLGFQIMPSGFFDRNPALGVPAAR